MSIEAGSDSFEDADSQTIVRTCDNNKYHTYGQYRRAKRKDEAEREVHYHRDPKIESRRSRAHARSSESGYKRQHFRNPSRHQSSHQGVKRPRRSSPPQRKVLSVVVKPAPLASKPKGVTTATQTVVGNSPPSPQRQQKPTVEEPLVPQEITSRDTTTPFTLQIGRQLSPRAVKLKRITEEAIGWCQRTGNDHYLKRPDDDNHTKLRRWVQAHKTLFGDRVANIQDQHLVTLQLATLSTTESSDWTKRHIACCTWHTPKKYRQ